MKKYIPVLEKCPLFRQITSEEILPLLGCLGARVIGCSKGEAIFTEGDPATYVGILLSGSAQIVKDDVYGNRSIVASVAPGQLFGETFACAGTDSLPVSVFASDACEIMLIDCRRITLTCSSACSFHSRIIFNLLHVMAEKNLMFQRKIEITAHRTTREKLMAYLLDQAKQNASTQFTIPFDRQSLADYLGVERSALSAEISKLKKDGVIDTSRSYFRLLNAGSIV